MEARVDDATIVLIHGLTIVREVENQLIGVPEALTAKGYRVHRTLVRGGGRLEELAERAWEQIDPVPGPLVLLCHSMGGLQARTFLLDDARAQRIRSIVTVGSPHAGTPLATVLGPFEQAYREMTSDSRSRWLQAHEEAESASVARWNVRCLSVTAALLGPPGYSRLRALYGWLSRTTGPNDGLVPAASQRWGEVLFEVNLDHLECACVDPPSPRAAEAVALWVRMADAAMELDVAAEPTRRRRERHRKPDLNP